MYILSCSQQDKESEKSINTGTWRGVITLPQRELPFNFELQKDKEGNYSLFLLNASERLAIDSISIRGDSIYIPMHIFDAQIVGKVSESSIEGFWIKNYAQDYRIPFKAAYGIAHRFESKKKTTPYNVSGKYAIRFADRPDTMVSVGVFEQQGNKVTGTILTRTGDYRYLEGIVDGNEMKLSTFDGEHAYLIEATIQSDSTMKGSFYSGKAKDREWRAVKDANARLPDPNSLTYLKKGYEKIDFSFPSAKEGTISLSDAKYEGKVVILQLFGTWCPNCMDETKFLGPWYEKNKSRGVEIIGLAYEKKADLNYARSRVRKMKERLNISYDFAIAGTSETESASKSLPMLNGVMSFPTTIFLDKKGNVRRIHTGFSGPGTGTYYEELVGEFNLFVDKLLNEEDSQGVNKK
jgi:thiol-disulfide isomerase/thioredoxin